MPKQMLYVFHHISKIVEQELLQNTHFYKEYGYDEKEQTLKDHYYKWAFLSCVYLYTIIEPRLDKDVTQHYIYYKQGIDGRSFTSTYIYETILQNKNQQNKKQIAQIARVLTEESDDERNPNYGKINIPESSLLQNIKMKRILKILLSQPTDATRENLLISRRFFRKIDDLYYQNRMLSLAQNTKNSNNLQYYANLKNLEQVYGVSGANNQQLKYQSVINKPPQRKESITVHLENSGIPAEPKDKSVFICQNYFIQSRHLFLLFDSYKQFIQSNFHNPNGFEGAAMQFFRKSPILKKSINQFQQSNDYLILNGEKYPIDDIDIMLKYQNLYKDSIPLQVSKFGENEIVSYLKASNSQKQKNFFELLNAVNQIKSSPEFQLNQSRDKMVNPYQLVFDQINVASLVDLIQDLINSTKVLQCQNNLKQIARDIIENNVDWQKQNQEVFKKTIPRLLQNQRVLQSYLVLQEVIDSDLTILENENMILKQRVLFSSQFT